MKSVEAYRATQRADRLAQDFLERMEALVPDDSCPLGYELYSGKTKEELNEQSK